MIKPLRILVEGFGWYGLVALLGAYALVSFGMTSANGLVFQTLNLTGGVGLGMLTYFKKAYQNMILNIVWVGIAIASIFKILFGAP